MKDCCKDVKDNQLPEEAVSAEKKKGMMKWVKRFGVAGFMFFLIKGILWLTVGAAAIKYFGCNG